MQIISTDLNLYKIFYVVSKSTTFSSAAKKLYISQPAVSYSIKSLEKQLNCKLFCRNTKKVLLTFEGSEILNKVEAALNLIISAENKLKDISNLQNGHIAIGTPSHIGVSYLSSIIARFRNDFPNISFEIVSKPTNELIKLMNNNEIEILIDTMPINFPPNTSHKILKNLNLCFASSTTNWKDQIFSKLNLLQSRLILPPKNTNIRETIDSLFLEQGQELTPTIEASTTEMIKHCVLNNLGYGLFIKETILNEINSNELKEISIDFTLPKINLCLAFQPSEISLAAKQFIEEYLK